MAFSEVIYDLLSTSDELVDIIGMKMYPLIVAQSEKMPYVAWSLSKVPVDTHEENIQQFEYTLFMHSVNIDYDKAHLMDELIFNHLNGRANITNSGYNIQLIKFESMTEAFEEGWDNFHIISTYKIKVNR